VALDQGRIDAGLRGLGLVRVHDDPAEHVGRRTRSLGQPRREQAGRARLGGGHGQRRRAVQETRDLLVDGGAVLGEERVAVALSDHRDEPVVGVLRRRLVPRGDLDLPAPQARRDLELVERHPVGLGRPQRCCDLGLRNPE
jgi:hypothetical protein